MSIEYRGDGKFRFRVRKDGINYSLNYFCNKKITEEDLKKKNYPKEIQDAHKKFEVDIMIDNIGSNENMKFSELSQLVFDEYIKQNLRLTSQGNYKMAANNYFLPEFGAMKVSKIKPLHIQQLVNKLSEKLMPNTVKSVYRELHKTFVKGVEWELIKESPCRNIKLPKVKKINYTELLSAENIKKLLNAIDLQEGMYKVIYSIAIYTGMRQGEILGLKISDIDFANNTINIDKQQGYVLEDGKQVRASVDTKTANSVRMIFIPQFLADIIKDYINGQKIINKDGYLFYNFKWDKVYNREWITRKFTEMLKANNIPHIRFHDMRHLYATMAINSGVNVVVVAKNLGDTVETVLKNYTHEIEEERKKATHTFEAYVKNL